ncbi:GspH/FimT family protein [Pseudomonas brassicacearum]|uniref:Type II secretion system protein H n=1 Tax=Pseudomonas brassicacearum TaxID=930166 RepID=A0A423GQ74_9PSED|nr:GspH/FimT family protein [Pseudomonas brassicacearum]ROM95980.1 general secretion pathway protein GspH [Pseudomonas brassicacearum]
MHQKGFGLIELLIGLAIAAIVLQQVSPVLSEYTQSVRRETAAQTLASGMRNARTEAILRNQTLVIHALNDDWAQGWRIILDISGEGHQDSSNPLLLERQTSAGVPIVGNRPVKSFVRFGSLGEPQLPSGAFQAGTLHICAGREPVSHHQVVLSRSGRVSLRSDKAEQALCAGGEESEQGANA